MAKRKRLTPPNPGYLETPPASEAKGPFAHPAPIAGVARDAAATAALDEMAQTLAQARDEGRMVLSLPLEVVQQDYLVRDRLVAQDAEMAALIESLRARGQQTPIEAADLGDGQYGLISGWRRCQALRQLSEETGEARFGTVLALLRRPDQASDAYLAMVEENEIRVGLSYYERARIVAKSVEQGVFETNKAALGGLFASASRAKRSKIGSFLRIVAALDGALRFPEALSERAGLALSYALDDCPDLGLDLRAALTAADPATPPMELELIRKAVDKAGNAKNKTLTQPNSRQKSPSPPRSGTQVAPGIWMQTTSTGRISLSGERVTSDLQQALRDWLAQHF